MATASVLSGEGRPWELPCTAPQRTTLHKPGGEERPRPVPARRCDPIPVSGGAAGPAGNPAADILLNTTPRLENSQILSFHPIIPPDLNDWVGLLGFKLLPCISVI